MKLIGTLIKGAKAAIKYGAVVMAIIKIVEFAVNEFETLNSDTPPEKLNK